MEKLTRTKPNMAVLKRDILPVSPFALLSQAFSEDIAGRWESSKGFFPMYELELLRQEAEEQEGQKPDSIHLELQLKLILQQMREQGTDSPQRRILERAEQMRLVREKTIVRRETSLSKGESVHHKQEFHPGQNLAADRSEHGPMDPVRMPSVGRQEAPRQQVSAAQRGEKYTADRAAYSGGMDTAPFRQTDTQHSETTAHSLSERGGMEHIERPEGRTDVRTERFPPEINRPVSAAGELKTQTGRQIGSLPNLNSTISGVAEDISAARNDISAGGGTAAMAAKASPAAMGSSHGVEVSPAALARAMAAQPPLTLEHLQEGGAEGELSPESSAMTARALERLVKHGVEALAKAGAAQAVKTAAEGAKGPQEMQKNSAAEKDAQRVAAASGHQTDQTRTVTGLEGKTSSSAAGETQGTSTEPSAIHIQTVSQPRDSELSALTGGQARGVETSAEPVGMNHGNKNSSTSASPVGVPREMGAAPSVIGVTRELETTSGAIGQIRGMETSAEPIGRTYGLETAAQDIALTHGMERTPSIMGNTHGGEVSPAAMAQAMAAQPPLTLEHLQESGAENEFSPESSAMTARTLERLVKPGVESLAKAGAEMAVKAAAEGAKEIQKSGGAVNNAQSFTVVPAQQNDKASITTREKTRASSSAVSKAQGTSPEPSAIHIQTVSQPRDPELSALTGGQARGVETSAEPVGMTHGNKNSSTSASPVGVPREMGAAPSVIGVPRELETTSGAIGQTRGMETSAEPIGRTYGLETSAQEIALTRGMENIPTVMGNTHGGEVSPAAMAQAMAAQPPLTLEYLQESGMESELSAENSAMTARTLERLVKPSMEALAKAGAEMAVKAAAEGAKEIQKSSGAVKNTQHSTAASAQQNDKANTTTGVETRASSSAVNKVPKTSSEPSAIHHQTAVQSRGLETSAQEIALTHGMEHTPNVMGNTHGGEVSPAAMAQAMAAQPPLTLEHLQERGAEGGIFAESSAMTARTLERLVKPGVEALAKAGAEIAVKAAAEGAKEIQKSSGAVKNTQHSTAAPTQQKDKASTVTGVETQTSSSVMNKTHRTLSEPSAMSSQTPDRTHGQADSAHGGVERSIITAASPISQNRGVETSAQEIALTRGMESVPGVMGNTHGGEVSPAAMAQAMAAQPPLTLEHLRENGAEAEMFSEATGMTAQTLERLVKPGVEALAKAEAAIAAKAAAEIAKEREQHSAARKDTHRPGGTALTRSGKPMTVTGTDDRTAPTAMGMVHGMETIPVAISAARGIETTPAAMGVTHGVETSPGAVAQAMAAQPPVELAHMTPGMEGAEGGAFTPKAGGPSLEDILKKELERSGGAQSSAGQSREGTQSGTAPGRAVTGSKQMTSVRPMRSFLRGTTADQQWQAATGGYQALNMEYGGAMTAMVQEVRRTVSREMGSRTPAAKAMEEKAGLEVTQTMELMSQPKVQQQTVWQNPYMRSGPSEMAHYQKNTQNKGQPQRQSQPRMSDAEIRRTADKVFKLVQEKILTERRRTGRV